MYVHKNRHVSDDIVAVISDDRERGRMLFVEGIGFFRKVKALPKNGGLGIGLVEQMPAPLEKFQWSNCLESHASIFAAKIRGLWTRKMRTILALAAVLVVSGCATTVDDFVALTPDQRAEKACNNVNEFKQDAKELNAILVSISQTEMDLARGYKIHRTCRTVQTPGSGQTNCYQTFSGIQCDTVTYPNYQTVCDEIPVSINPEFESQKLEKLKKLYPVLKESLENRYGACYQAVLHMTPEQAFTVWKSRTKPSSTLGQ
nr:MAG TPA: hypothetical protein [Caudoviricetes sp.]